MRIALILVTSLAMLLPRVSLGDADYSDLVAADDESAFIDEFTLLMEDAGIVESAARHRQEIGMSPSAISVITREDIEASGATTFVDLLRIVPGVGVIVSTHAFPATVGRVPWTAENLYFLVLIDGREANIELLGSTPWEAQPISLEDVERIEIIRGPGSSLYGANAVAGVISISTRAVQDQTSTWASVAGGEAGFMAAGARASTRLGDWGISVSGGGTYMGTFEDPRVLGKQGWKLRSVVEYRWTDSQRLVLDAGMSEGNGFVDSNLGMLDGTMSFRGLRLAYASEDLRGHVYWSNIPTTVSVGSDLVYGGVRLATFVPVTVDAHTIDTEVQWTLPGFFEPLLIIVGGGGRVSWLGSDQLLDAETYADPSSPDYHKTGISHWEFRSGAFVHAELAPVDWVTVTAGMRLDYNTETNVFLSPRLAAVFRPGEGQFLRLGVARAFRKPPFLDGRLHAMVDFPDDSPITGQGRQKFLEFMTRVSGNAALDNEELLSAEAGYLGQFLDKRLNVSLDLYWNLFLNEIRLIQRIVPDEQGLPNLDTSTAYSENTGLDYDIVGGELSLRFELSELVSLMAFWDIRQVLNHETGRTLGGYPKNMLALGGRFRTGFGLLGSLYAFSRSEYRDLGVQNPVGLFAKPLTQQLGNAVLLLGRLGWNWRTRGGMEFEAGVRLSLPISSLTAPSFCYRENGGGITVNGDPYGGVELCRLLTGYLEGSF